MKTNKLSAYIVILFFISILSFSLFSDTPLIPSEEMIKFQDKTSCAAWYSVKSMIFKPRVAMAGVSCHITTRLEKKIDNFRLIAEMPLSSFDSADKGRDKYFRKALNEDVRPALLFESSALDKTKWRDIINGQFKTLTGELFIGNKKFPIVFTLKNNGTLIRGIFKGKFDDFGLIPHTVGPFGMVAKTENYLEIHFQLDFKNTTGINLLD
ncbi:MAG: hypothetical protein OEV78_04685 [Spirochaetia bacterium]|nr:hypothetical protein [Spirochaetia bacterium]